MTLIHVPTQGPGDWQRLLADPEKHWKAGYSAMAAARSWEDAQGLPAEIRAMFAPDAELLLAIPEYKVALPGGARASQCDVFALLRDAGKICAVAVEAKVNEPFGPTIGEWMNPPTDGRRTRLDAICTMLGIDGPPPDLRYQLFHRSAAAVVAAQRFGAASAAMIVQSFSPDHRWFGDFSAFCTLLGEPPQRGQAGIYRLPCGMELTLGWATGDPRFLAER